MIAALRRLSFVTLVSVSAAAGCANGEPSVASATGQLSGGDLDGLTTSEDALVADSLASLDRSLATETSARGRMRLRGRILRELVAELVGGRPDMPRPALVRLRAEVLGSSEALRDRDGATQEAAAAGSRYEPTPADLALAEEARARGVFHVDP